jgi:hypothetical protein
MISIIEEPIQYMTRGQIIRALVGTDCENTPDQLIDLAMDRGIVPGTVYHGTDGTWRTVEP